MVGALASRRFWRTSAGRGAFCLQNQSVLARGRSSEVHCEWEGAAGESFGFLPLGGLLNSIQFQFGFLPRPPVRELILPADSTRLYGGVTCSAFLALRPSQDAATPAATTLKHWSVCRSIRAAEVVRSYSSRPQGPGRGLRRLPCGGREYLRP